MKAIDAAVARIHRTITRPEPDKLALAAQRISATLTRADAEFREADHPRAEDGRFGSKTGKGPALSPQEPTSTPSNVTPKPRVSAPAAAALKGKPKHEIEYHATTEAWNDAPQIILDAISRTKSLNNVHIDPARGCFYQPGSHHISMTMPSSPGDKIAMTVWRHEYGHAIDFNGKREAQSSACKTMREYDARDKKKIRDIYLTNRLHAQGRLEEKEFDEWSRADGLMLSDFVCALTNNEEGYGHSKEYFESFPGARECEMFANYVSLISGKEGKKYTDVLHAMAPATCTAFDAILLKMGGKKSWFRR